MKNKTIAIIGIISYLLSVIASATNLEGSPRFPVGLIIVSGLLTIIFVVIAVVRLRKYAKFGAMALAASLLILAVFQTIQAISPLSDGNPVILLWSASKVIYFISFIWAVVKLFRSKDKEIINNK